MVAVHGPLILVDPHNDIRMGVIHVRAFHSGADVPTPAFRKVGANEPSEGVCFVQVLHLFMLILCLIAIGGAVAGNYDRFSF